MKPVAVTSSAWLAGVVAAIKSPATCSRMNWSYGLSWLKASIT